MAKKLLKPTIFREYIGVKPYPDNLDDFPIDIINSEIPEFHFILGFAKENYDENGRGTGNFKPTWNICHFSPEKVKKLKEKHNNVKVVISIGGRGAQNPFNPTEISTWQDNAIESLKKIIEDYKDKCGCHNLIDGIEINYDHVESNEEVFSDCIGKVIKKLKNNTCLSINVASIAPSHCVLPHYKRLYMEYLDLIDWVDFQFYDQKVCSKDEFVKLFFELTKDYDVHKLLAGVSTDPNDSCKISEDVFIEGCTELLNLGYLCGIFVWNANDSAVSKCGVKPFSLEEKLQKLITKYV